MAGDWLKMELCTPEKSEVLAITARMGWDDQDMTVGKLFRVWRWFDQHTTDGNAVGVTAALLDRVVGVSGFCVAMQSVGWLVIEQTGLTLPNFDRHNGNTAKNRALTAKRVANHKANAKANAHANAEGNAHAVSGALPREEKSREDKDKSTASAMPTPDGVSVETWQAFLKVRKAKRAPMSELALAGIQREADAAGWTLEAALTECVTRGWQSFKAEWVAKQSLPVQQNPILAGAI